MLRHHVSHVLWSVSFVAACMDAGAEDAVIQDDIDFSADEDVSVGDDPGTVLAPAAPGTTCLNADGPGGQDTYRLIEGVLGRGAVEHPDDDHRPAQRHIREVVDSAAGNAFEFLAHRDIDTDRQTHVDRSRIEIKVAPSGGRNDALKAARGSTFTYSWRFKLGAGMGFSNRFTHVFQLKSFGGDDGSPLITITGRKRGNKDILEVIHTGPPSKGVLASADLGQLKNAWLDVTVRATFDDRGSISMTIKKPGGGTVITVDERNLDLWRNGDHIRPKWGIYRGKSDQLRAQEETVRFASFAITPSASPTSTCR